MAELRVLATKEEFDSFLKEAGDKLVVIDFHATWCGPCKQIAPKIKAMAEKYKDSVLFAKIDVDENAEVAEAQGVTAMPTFFAYKNGSKVAEVVGANEAKVEDMISKNK